MESKAVRLFDLANEMLDILLSMSKEELEILKLEYDVAFNYAKLRELKSKGDKDDKEIHRTMGEEQK